MSLDKQMRKLISGDKDAFARVYAATRKSVYFVALSVLRDKSLAEDVMQTTYLKVLKFADNYKAGTNAAAWIVRIARNEALNLKSRRSREQYMDESENLALFGTSSTDDYGLLTDMARRMLSEDEFTILMLVTACGYKRREIGEMLSLPTPTVTWKYNSAIEKLRRALDNNGV